MNKQNDKEKSEEEQFPGYPLYPASEDIFNTGQIAEEIDPEDITTVKHKVEDYSETNEPLSGEDLDVPGAELDDSNEDIGNEDEENNYYSLGGDNHDDLEEDRIEYPEV